MGLSRRFAPCKDKKRHYAQMEKFIIEGGKKLSGKVKISVA